MPAVALRRSMRSVRRVRPGHPPLGIELDRGGEGGSGERGGDGEREKRG